VAPLPAVSGLSLESYDLPDVQTGTNDISLWLVDGHQKFDGFIKYNTDLFDHVFIERMASHLQNIFQVFNVVCLLRLISG
jgi:hypothetical protein